MAENKLKFLEESEDDKPNVEAQAEPEPEVEAEPVEAEAPEEAGDKPKEAAPPAAPQEDRHIPVAALLDERDKRKALEAELAEMRKWREEYDRKQREAPTPDPYEDPKGWATHQQVQFQQALFNERLNMSEGLARSRFGDDAVTEAQQAFSKAASADPGLGQRLMHERDPYAFVVNWHKRNSFLNEVGDDPEKWRQAERERLRQELLAEMQPAKPQAPSPAPAAPPRSLASAPNAGTGGNRPATGRGSAFDAIFGG